MNLPDFSGQNVGRYLLTSPITSGETRSVYTAVDPEHPSERFAIKCISKYELTHRQLLVRLSEVFHHQLVTGCSPHVLPLREVIDEDLYLFIVFQLCDGDLSHAIWNFGIFRRNDARVKKIFVDILDGVYACHMKGVFHRDLKPENILLDEGWNRVRIADFGHATRKPICTSSHCGTMGYMSPEHWSDDDFTCYSSFADVWSLGIILINMVTGRRPWEVAHVFDVRFRAFFYNDNHLYKTLPISPELSNLLKWIFSPNPLDRPRIPQIRKAILDMDNLFEFECFPEDLTQTWPEPSRPSENQRFLNRIGFHNSGCRPTSQRGFVRDLFE